MSRASSPLQDRMIFLVGARRSGTNWLMRVVGAHPDVAVIPSETYLFSRGIQPLRERFHHGVLSSTETGFLYMDEGALVEALREFCDRALHPFLAAAPGATRLVERTPEHARCVDLIGAIYPDAHIVHIVRDGRDVARSLLRQGWPSAPKTVEEAALEWRTSVEAAEDAGASLPNFMTVSYEALLADPLPQITALYGWLGLRTGSDIVRAALAEADVPYNVDPTTPKVATEKWREEFSAEDLETFTAVAGETLADHGYKVDVDVAAPSPSAPSEPIEPRRRFGAKRAAPVDPDRAFSRQVLAWVRTAQKDVGRIVTAFNRRSLEQLTAIVNDGVSVQFVSPAEDWKGRGTEAWQRLASVIRDDPALGARQVRGDLHVGVPTLTAILTFEDGSGARYPRAIVISLSNGRIDRVAYYQL